MTSVTVAIQGEAGSFSHAAALQALGPDIRLVPCPSFDELFRAVEAGDAARGAVPIENSLAGAGRSEEHTSELQSQSKIVCRLLLEKKKKNNDKSRLSCY